MFFLLSSPTARPVEKNKTVYHFMTFLRRKTSSEDFRSRKLSQVFESHWKVADFCNESAEVACVALSVLVVTLNNKGADY